MVAHSVEFPQHYMAVHSVSLEHYMAVHSVEFPQHCMAVHSVGILQHCAEMKGCYTKEPFLRSPAEPCMLFSAVQHSERCN